MYLQEVVFKDSTSQPDYQGEPTEENLQHGG